MSPVTDHEGGGDALRLPITTLEWHALEALRNLALCNIGMALRQAPTFAQIQHHVSTLRAIGHALEARHGTSWQAALERIRWDLRARLDEGAAPDLIVYASILDLMLTLRHSPADSRLAPPGLGLQFVRLAVAFEHRLVLSSPSERPGPPLLPDQLLSPRDLWLLEVTRTLAALELWEHLPLGHRITVSEVRHLLEAWRRALTEQAEVHRTTLDMVLAQAREELASGNDDDPTCLDTLRDALAVALITPAGGEAALVQDAAVLLCLEDAARALAQGHQR